MSAELVGFGGKMLGLHVRDSFFRENFQEEVSEPHCLPWRSNLKRFNHNSFDLDILDTTYLEQNVQNVRHSYFNLNPLILDDYSEILLNRKRAIYRTSKVVRVKKNIFSFVCAPPYLVNP